MFEYNRECRLRLNKGKKCFVLCLVNYEMMKYCESRVQKHCSYNKSIEAIVKDLCCFRTRCGGVGKVAGIP